MEQRLFIFDMDGVLVDSEPLYAVVLRRMMKAMGVPFSDEEHKAFIGMGSREMWRILAEKHGLDERLDSLVEREARMRLEYLSRCDDLTPMEGVTQLLEKLRGIRIPLCVASSSPKRMIELNLTRTGIIHYFDLLLSSEESEIAKPDPGFFLHIASLRGVPPQRCAVIDDSGRSITGAKKAGMHAIGFVNKSSGEQDLSRADLLVEGFAPEGIDSILAYIGESLGGVKG